MEESITNLLRSVLERAIRYPQGKLFVGLSGGVDSVVLLHMLCRVRQQQDLNLVALHVDHGLHGDAKTWLAHCSDLCANWDVEFRHTSLELPDAAEATARTARYEWFRQQVKFGDTLLTAHHRQDRAETVLFNLMRGSGSAGLSSLRAERPFFGAYLMRPLLQWGKDEILSYATQNELQWVEDPSNQDVGYARNQIRHTILPALNSFRADAVKNIARAASNLEQEHSLLREIAIADLAEVREQPKHALDGSYALCVQDIEHLSTARQTNLLRFWLGSLNLHMPSKRLMLDLLQGIKQPPASTAVLQEEGSQFRFYRGFLYVMPAQSLTVGFQAVEWQNLEQPLDLFGRQVRIDATQKLRQYCRSERRGRLCLQPREALQNPQALHGHSLNLKKWLQEVGIPPWRRQSLPILAMRQGKRDVVLAPVDQNVESEWVDLQHQQVA